MAKQISAEAYSAKSKIKMTKADKVLNGILRSCEKRPVPLADIEKLIDDIEAKLYNMLEREVTSERIGEMVMERLKDLDDIAYVRFASVYRQFKDINSFMDELAKIIKKA